MLLQSKGLRISLAGAVVFVFGLLALIVLSRVVGLVALLIGGLGIWGGFIRTLFGYYGPSSPPPPPGS